MATPKPTITLEELSKQLIDDNLVNYLCDTDIADQIVDWAHKEIGLAPRIAYRIAFKLLTMLLVNLAQKGGGWTLSVAKSKSAKVLAKLPFYDALAKWLLDLKARLDTKEHDRQLIDKILSGERPPHDEEYGKSLAQEMRVALKTLEDNLTTHEKLDAIQESIAELLSPQPPLELWTFEPDPSNRLVYRAQRVPFVGREKELDGLQKFIDDERNFLWWIVYGPGGLGKSRLALELCLRKGAGWRVGFLPSWHSFERWHDWKPDQPTLIVIDYAAGREDDLHKIIGALYAGQGEFDYPARFLLLERSASGPWWDKLHGYGSDKHTIEHSRYAPPLLLEPMSEDDLWATIEFILKSNETPIPNRAETLGSLLQIDNERRPLYAALAAEAILAGNDIRGWGKTDLLEALIRREQEEVWRKQGVTPEYENLLALATMTGGMATDVLDSHELVSSLCLPTAKDFSAGIYSCLVGKQADDFLGPLEPDILGEYFVVRKPDPNKPLLPSYCRSMGSVAWQLDEVGFAIFFLRATSDFGEYAPLELFMQLDRGNNERRETWGKAVVSLTNYLGKAQRFAEARDLYHELIALSEQHEDEAEVRLRRAKAAVNLTYDLGKAQRFDEAQDICNELKALVKEYQELDGQMKTLLGDSWLDDFDDFLRGQSES
ncbi:MAG: hypothetical protein ABIJ61_09465 [bacterium]